ncbi:hypothetical protein F4604DRAFT_1681511 [Suillus subluteus]|nr:hypothetical protein F4604DRAFT_1681511 [Suillus subluteus]
MADDQTQYLNDFARYGPSSGFIPSVIKLVIVFTLKYTICLVALLMRLLERNTGNAVKALMDLLAPKHNAKGSSRKIDWYSLSFGVRDQDSITVHLRGEIYGGI